jgi:hypothetical protein
MWGLSGPDRLPDPDSKKECVAPSPFVGRVLKQIEAEVGAGDRQLVGLSGPDLFPDPDKRKRVGNPPSLPFGKNWKQMRFCWFPNFNSVRPRPWPRLQRLRSRPRTVYNVSMAHTSRVDALPKEHRDDVSRLLLFESEGPTPCAVAALLVLCCGSPKMQFFADCGLDVADMPPVRRFAARDPPFDLTVLDRHSRLGHERFAASLRSIAFSTSDELGMYLLDAFPRWSVCELQYEDILVGRSILRVHVTGKGPELPHLAHRQQQPRRADAFWPEELDRDPFQSGLEKAAAAMDSSSGRASARTEPKTSSTAIGAAMEDDRESGDEMDQELLVGDDEHSDLPQDMLHDMAEEIFHDAAEVFALPGGPEPQNTESDDAEDLETDAALTAIAADVLGNAAAAEPVLPSKAELIASCRIDAEGFVKTHLMPWAAWSPIAKITTWPKTKPLEKRNVGIRCNMHSAKCSLAKKRAQYTDQQLLGWLFSVDPPEPMATGAEIDAQTLIHLRKPIPPPDSVVGGSSSSAGPA